ncbi:hypothetical protein HQ487_05520 [Candidatus Uhrbacteria bacterium]|nr:hypothetical protein [Candidatus Uhrbacteria bacterium]
MFGLFGRGREMPSREMPPQQKKESSPAQTNEEIMTLAIAEFIWNSGMTQNIEGDVDDKKKAAKEMAEEALRLVPDKYKTLPTEELKQHKGFLVKEAMRLYNEQNTQEANDDYKNQAQAAK